MWFFFLGKKFKVGKIDILAASLFKPRGSKRGKKVAAYSPEITVHCNSKYSPGFLYLGFRSPGRFSWFPLFLPVPLLLFRPGMGNFSPGGPMSYRI
jgi:hypothetical protein